MRQGAEDEKKGKPSGLQRSLTPTDLDWLAARRVGHRPAKTDAGTFVSDIREESER
jgi:hypothetical protein